MQPTEPLETFDGFADALRGLELQAPATSPAQLFYRAGYEAGKRSATTWKAVAASIALLGALAVAWTSHESRRDRIPIARVHSAPVGPISSEPMVEQTPAHLFSGSQLALRDALLQRGLDALPMSNSGESQDSLRAGSSPDRIAPPDPDLPENKRG